MTELENIIKGCKSGNRNAQRALYDMFAEQMFGVCQYYSKDRTEAEDTLHEGFMRIFQKIDQYDGRGSFAGWMRRIMINTALEKYRRKHQLYVLNDEIDTGDDIVFENVIDNISAQDLIGLIRELTPQYRIVFNLYAIEGYSHKEISEMLGISEGTSKSNLSRARNILQQKVKNHFYNAPKIRANERGQ